MQDPAPSGSSPGVRQDRLPSAAHAIARASAAHDPVAGGGANRPPPPAARAARALPAALLFALVFVEGFVSLGAEIVALRRLVPHVGSAITVTAPTIGFFLLALALGYLLFDEVPTGTMLVGVGLIVAAGLVIIHRERKLGLERARARRAVTPQG